jgi:amino acid transporter
LPGAPHRPVVPDPSPQGRRSGRLVLKRALVGRAKASSLLEHTLLSKLIALPVFSSDPLSSNAYATEEILAVLLATSATSVHLVMPIAVAIGLLMAIVVSSYRQTVRAYPSGGGAYIVSKENLGTVPGLVAAASLLIDYVLTVSVSVTAGVIAITSAFPSAAAHAVPLSLAFVVLLTLANLRGVKEAGSVFAVPTYAFVACVFVMVAVGLMRCATGCPTAEPLASAHELARTVGPVSLFVVLHAFSSGSTALTGVEAISNGVPAFRRPQAANAARTLGVMGAMAIAMFIGISFLATHIDGITVSEERSVVAQIAHAVFGGGVGFYIVQAFTAAILILAANTAYQDFPRLSAILARDRFMPSQFRNRGDRLVFSNGVIVLAVLAGLLIYIFDASLSGLIQLYVVGVFTSFTLSQTGMVRHWLRERRRGSDAARGWRRSIAINAVGAVTTGVVLVVITSTKFIHGAWIVIAAMPLVVLMLRAIHRHYRELGEALRRRRSTTDRAATSRFVFLVRDLGPPTTDALAYLRALRPRSVTPVYIGDPRRFDAMAAAWTAAAPRLGGLERLPTGGNGTIRTLRAYLKGLEHGEMDFVTVIVPEAVSGSSWWELVTRQRFAILLKAALLFLPGVVVTDVPFVPAARIAAERDPSRTLEHNRSVVLIPVSAVHDATVQAIVYAKSLNAARIEALFLAADHDEVPRMLEDWATWEIDIPLSVIDAPFRDLGPPTLEEVRRYTGRGDTIVTVVLPEILVTRWWEFLLHGQAALFFKRLLLTEPNVVVTSVPLHLSPAQENAAPAPGRRSVGTRPA